MRILVLVPYLGEEGGGGVPNYFRSLRLDREPDIDYFFVNRRGTQSVLAKIFLTGFIYIDFVRAAASRQLIHVNPSLSARSYYREMVLVLLARLLRKKVLVFFRGWENEFEQFILTNRVQSFLFRHSYAKAHRFVVFGDHFKEKLVALGVSSDKPFHAETTVADSSQLCSFDLCKKLNSVKDEFRILLLSRILRDKGIFIAMDAFAECQKAVVDREMSLVIAGSGPELEEAKAYAERRRYVGIRFTGEVSGAEKAKLLESCHVMILPTFHGEGLPNCILEGMLYGMPIVSRVNGAIPDVVKDNVNGYLTDSMDSATFAAFLRRLVLEPAAYTKMAITNHQIARARFTTETVKARLLAVYREMESR